MSDEKNGIRAWAIMVLCLGLGVCFAQSMYKAVATLPFIMDDYGVGIAQAGNLMAILGYVSMVMSLPGGVIIQKVGARRAAIVCAALAIAGNILAIATSSFSMLLVSRLFEGVGYGLISIIMQSFINAWFTPDKRGLPLSLSNLYLSVGMIFSLNVASVIVPAFGWKGNWWLNLVLFSVMTALFWLFAKMPTEKCTIEESPDAQREGGFKAVFSVPVPWLLALIFFCYAFSFSAFNGYYPTYLVQQLGMDSATANGITSIFTVAMAIATFLIGVVLNKVAPAKHPLLLLFCMALYAAASVPMFRLSDGIIAYLVAFGFFSGTLPGIIFSVAPRAFESPSMIPVTLGVIMLGMGIAGSLGTQVVGMIVEASGWGGVTTLLIALGVAGCAAGLLTHRTLARKSS